jgi:hypothetical protein
MKALMLTCMATAKRVQNNLVEPHEQVEVYGPEVGSYRTNNLIASADCGRKIFLVGERWFAAGESRLTLLAATEHEERSRWGMERKRLPTQQKGFFAVECG